MTSADEITQDVIEKYAQFVNPTQVALHPYPVKFFSLCNFHREDLTSAMQDIPIATFGTT